MTHPPSISAEIEKILTDFLSKVESEHVAPEWVEQLRSLIANDQLGDTTSIAVALAQLRENKRDG